MKKISIWILSTLLFTSAVVLGTDYYRQKANSIFYQTLAVGDSSGAVASAVLDVKSTTQGALLPRMTTTQRNAISSPATGLMIYNTSNTEYESYTGSTWVAVGLASPVSIANGGTGQTTKAAAFDALQPMSTSGALIYGGTAGTGTALTIGSSGNVLTVSAGLPVWQAPASSGVKIAYIRDEESSGTNGGTCTSGSFLTRTLNTITDPNSIVTSLSSNQFVLPAGTYYIWAQAPGNFCDQHKTKLRNITDSTDTFLGSNGFSSHSNAGGVNTPSIITGVFTIAGSKTFEIQHRCTTTQTTNGFGTADSYSVVEVYTQVILQLL